MSNEYPPQEHQAAAEQEQRVQSRLLERMQQFNTEVAANGVPTAESMSEVNGLARQLNLHEDTSRLIGPDGEDLEDDREVINQALRYAQPEIWTLPPDEEQGLSEFITRLKGDFADLSPEDQELIRDRAEESGRNRNKLADLNAAKEEARRYAEARVALSGQLTGREEEIRTGRFVAGPETTSPEESITSPDTNTPEGSSRPDPRTVAERVAERARRRKVKDKTAEPEGDQDASQPPEATDTNPSAPVTPSRPSREEVRAEVARNRQHRANQRRAEQERRRAERAAEIADEDAHEVTAEDMEPDDEGKPYDHHDENEPAPFTHRDRTDDDRHDLDRTYDDDEADDFSDDPIYVRDRSADTGRRYDFDDEPDYDAPHDRGDRYDRYDDDYVDSDELNYDDDEDYRGARSGRRGERRGESPEESGYRPCREVLAVQLQYMEDNLRQMMQDGVDPGILREQRRRMTQQAYAMARGVSQLLAERGVGDEDDDLDDDLRTLHAEYDPYDDDDEGGLADRLRRARRRMLDGETNDDEYDPDGVYDEGMGGYYDEDLDTIPRARPLIEYRRPLSEQTPLTTKQLREILAETRRAERPSLSDRTEALLDRMGRARDALRDTTNAFAERFGFDDREQLRRALTTRLLGALSSLRLWEEDDGSSRRRPRS